MAKSVMRQQGSAWIFHNGERETRAHRGGIVDIVNLPESGVTRVDLYSLDPGVLVNVGVDDGRNPHAAVLGTVTRALWATWGAKRDATEDDYRDSAREALGVCRVTGRLDCAERDCELHTMAAPVVLAPDLNATYESRQVARVLDDGPNPDTGGKFYVQLHGNTKKTHSMSVNEGQVRRIAAILAENEQ